MRQFLDDYFTLYKEALFGNVDYDNFLACKELLVTTQQNGNKALIQGNGASAAIASHCALDFTKQAKVRVLSFNESSLITAFVNDFGADQWLKKAYEAYADPGDVGILISSSGSSPNVVRAAEWLKEQGMQLITFTGFSEGNPLKSLGDINFWVNSKAYNVIECTHMIWLTTVIDMIIGKAEYTVS